jgi:hypothetical protein
MVWIMRHRQTKGPDTDRPDLNNRVTSRLYPFLEVSPFGTLRTRGSDAQVSSTHSIRRSTQAAATGLGGSLLPGLMSVKGCTDFAHVCAVNADSLVKLFTGDAEGPRGCYEL